MTCAIISEGRETATSASLGRFSISDSRGSGGDVWSYFQ